MTTFCKRVNETPETRKLLTGWGLALDNQPLSVHARQLPEEQIVFANRTVAAGINADFGKHATSSQLLQVIDLHEWIVLHTRADFKAAKAFIECMDRNSRPMGIRVCAPKVIVLDDDKTDTYVTILRRSLTAQTQIVVCICPTSRDDRYAAIKKICCAESPIPSQVSTATSR